MNFSDLLSGMLQAGMSPSSGDRVRNALGGGGGGLLESLSGMLGGGQSGGLGDALSGMLGGGGLGGMLGDVLGQAGRAVGGNQNLDLGGLGALAGALLGGGQKSTGGGLGGGVMAMLGALAFSALKGSGSRQPDVPLGLRAPQTSDERDELEHNAELVLKAMINAAKADGRIDKKEIGRIAGKLEELGADQQSQSFVMAEVQKPLETEALIGAARDRPELAAQIYAASLLAIEVDTAAEKAYMEDLSYGLGLAPEVTRRIRSMVGLE